MRFCKMKHDGMHRAGAVLYRSSDGGFLPLACCRLPADGDGNALEHPNTARVLGTRVPGQY
jgi:hypothetical protein